VRTVVVVILNLPLFRLPCARSGRGPRAGDVVFDSPVVANGVVYVGSLDGNVYAFGLTNGSSQAKQEAASTPTDMKTLLPDLNLRVSKRIATAPRH
jgi:outer membrane protein assembly factor BamB